MRGQQRAGGGGDLGLGPDGQARGLGQFRAARRDQVGAGVKAVVAALRVHHHPAPGGARGGDQALRRVAGQHPLLVVGQHHDRGRGHRIRRDPHQPVGQALLDGARRFVVGAHHLLAGGDEAGLGRGGAAALHQQPGLDARLAADQPGQVAARLVVPHHGHEGHRRTERGQVADDIARAAGQGDLALHRQDGNRRLGGDALHPAINVAVQHRVAHHQDGGAAKLADRIREIGKRGVRLRACAGRGAFHDSSVAQPDGTAQGAGRQSLGEERGEQPRRRRYPKMNPTRSPSSTAQVSGPP